MNLAQVIEGTLSPVPDTRNAAEAHLNEAMKHPSHGLDVLRLISSANGANPAVLQAAAVHFKNMVKHGWDESKDPEDRKGISISPQDRETIKDNVVELMCTVPPQIQAQISEGISLIAEQDFPERWMNLLDTLVQKLNSPDMAVVNGVLATANSIFKRFRYVRRTDELYKVIIHSLQKFQEPLLILFVQTGKAIEGFANDKAQLVPRVESLRTMARIFYSLNYQDLPEYFEDHIKEWMDEFSKYLTYNNPLLVDDAEEDEPGPIDKLQTAIIQNLKLYGDKDEECFLPFLPNFTTLVWNRLTSLSTLPKYDPIVTHSIKFLSSLVEKKMHNHLFEADATLQQIVSRIVIPNLRVRESDEEKFEDDPQEFIITEIEGSDSDSRRKCSRDLLRAMCRQFEVKTTTIGTQHINQMLGEFATNSNNWQSKDTAIQLMLGIAILTESYQGVAQLNSNVNLMDFFTTNIFPELQDANHSNRPMVKATCLKFVCSFRKQFTKDQLLALIPVLGSHLSSHIIVVHTLAAYSIERILMTIEESTPGVKKYKIGRADLTQLLEQLFTGLFAIIDNAGWNENEHVMKCIMRLLARIGPDVIPVTNIVFGKLASALERVCKNPRNPSYNHYLFESIAALVRNSCSQDVALVGQLEALLFPPFQSILQADISEFTPYVFQVLAQLLEFRPEGAGLGDAYKQLFKPLLNAQLWERKSNVPALARLMQAYIQQAPNDLMSDIVPILGIFQSLNASSSTEGPAFEILRALTTYFPQENILRYAGTLFQIILTKLMTAKTAKNKYRPLAVSYFALFSGLYGGQMWCDTINGIQQGLPLTFIDQVWVNELEKGMPTRLEGKIQVVGLTRILCDTSAILDGPNGQQIWARAFKGVMEILASETLSTQATESDDAEPEIAYDAAYSKLSLAAKKPADPFPSVADPVTAFCSAIQNLASQRPGVLGPIIQAGLAGDEKLTASFQSMVQKQGLRIA